MNGSDDFVQRLRSLKPSTRNVAEADTTIPQQAPTTPSDSLIARLRKMKAIQGPGDSLINRLQRIKSGQPLAEDTLSPVVAEAQARRAAMPTFAERHPIIQTIVVDQLRKAATAIKFSLIGNPMSPIGSAALQAYLASKPPEEAQREMNDAMEGSALILSFGGGEIVSGMKLAPVIGRLLGGTETAGLVGKWASFTAGEMLGGSIYGGIRPLEEDETRQSAILGDAATFAALGVGTKAALEIAVPALKRYILRLPTAKRDAVLAEHAANRDGLDVELARGGVNLENLPPDQVVEIEHPLLANAIRKVEPEANIDEIAAAGAAEVQAKPSIDDEFQRTLQRVRLSRAPRVLAPEGGVQRVAYPGRKAIEVPIRPEESEHMLAAVEPRYAAPKGEPSLPTTRGTLEIPAPEYIIGPTVRGHSGKLYVGGARHPEIIADAVDKGVPIEEFAGIHAEHPNRGFRTNLREFATREEAAALVGQADPLFSESLHAARATPLQSPAIADLQMENIAKTAIAATDPESAPIRNAAMMDAVVDHVVANTDPLEVANQGVKSEAGVMKSLLPTSEITETAIGDAIARHGDSGEAEREILQNLTDPSPSELAEGASKTPHEQAQEAGPKRGEPPIKMPENCQIKAPDMEPPSEQKLTVPKQMNGMEIAGYLKDDHLNGLARSVLRVARDKGGFATSRLLLATVGGYIDSVAWSDDKLTEGQKFSLWALGSFMILGATHARIAQWMRETGFTRKLILLHNPEMLMSSEHAGHFRELQEAITASDFLARSYGKHISELFSDRNSQHALMFVIDEGPTAPEFHSLTADQQKFASNMHEIYKRLGVWERGSMLSKGRFEETYVRNVLPNETYQRWKDKGFRIDEKGKRVRITKLRDLETFAAKERLPGPSVDAARIHEQHLKDTYHAMAANNMGHMLRDKGAVLAIPKDGIVPEGYRVVTARGFAGTMAPEPVAQALENLATPALSNREIVNALDAIKSAFMQTIMIFPWEHGLNVLRAVLASPGNPLRLISAWKAIRDLDPALVHAVNNGLNLFDRPDFGPLAHQGWQKLMGAVGGSLGSRMGAQADRMVYGMEKWLWDQWVPASQYLIYAERMRVWGNKVGHAFLPSSPEYKAAARAAADYANTAIGKLPSHLANPELARWMRILMFSPKWTTTRMAMVAHAAGELNDMIAGDIRPRDALYLRMKLRQVGLGIAMTYGLSKMISGNSPQFNPNTGKFYARTNWKNAKGQEMGLDLTGWWQGDFKMFNHPVDYMASRLNPVIDAGYETIHSRDYLGRPMTTGQSIQNIIESFGPLGQIPSTIVRAATGGMRKGEIAQTVSGLSATGNVATLPRTTDVTIARLSKKLLITQGLTASDDNIFNLSRIIRANIMQGQSPIDGQVINYLAYQRRNQRMRAGIGTKFDHLWQEARHVVGNIVTPPAEATVEAGKQLISGTPNEQ